MRNVAPLALGLLLAANMAAGGAVAASAMGSGGTTTAVASVGSAWCQNSMPTSPYRCGYIGAPQGIGGFFFQAPASSGDASVEFAADDGLGGAFSIVLCNDRDRNGVCENGGVDQIVNLASDASGTIATTALCLAPAASGPDWTDVQVIGFIVGPTAPTPAFTGQFFGSLSATTSSCSTPTATSLPAPVTHWTYTIS